jgi:EAL domain-containing protein (putative c-di-GMP-specific phosphodiesterase class I)/ActR/RegA family two-component response regulator
LQPGPGVQELPSLEHRPDRLLVLDDEAAVCRWVARVAAQCGYETATTQDPAGFAAVYASFHPTLILLDLVLGAGDGIEVLRQLAALNCRAPIVLMSGLDERVLSSASRLGQALALDIVGAALKPLSLSDLRALLESRRAQPAPPPATALPPSTSAAGDRRHGLVALETSALVVHYQPQRRLSDGLVAGAEALVRWRHPEAGLLGPAAFLERAERSGFVRALTESVLADSVRQCRRWADEGHHVPVAINLSAVLLDDLSLPDHIERVTLEAGVSPGDVTLEVTESVAIARRQLAMDVLTRLRLKGFRLALDDFGVGFSSLLELQHMPFTDVKIDKSFVAEAASDPSARAIVDAVSGLGQRLSLRIVAEGIETQAAWSLACAAGCDVGQGYLISRPLDVAAFDGFLARENRPQVRVASGR